MVQDFPGLESLGELHDKPAQARLPDTLPLIQSEDLHTHSNTMARMCAVLDLSNLVASQPRPLVLADHQQLALHPPP